MSTFTTADELLQQHKTRYLPIHCDVDYATGATIRWIGPNEMGNYVTYDWYAAKRYYLLKGLELRARDGWHCENKNWFGWDIWVSSYKGRHTVFKHWKGEGQRPPIRRFIDEETIKSELREIRQKLNDMLERDL